MNKEMTINGKSYTIIKLLGKGKGGYSYLAESGNNRYVLTQIHHEPCDYYQFGNKLTGGMRSCFREQSQFCVFCHTEKNKTPGNTIRYFLCL